MKLELIANIITLLAAGVVPLNLFRAFKNDEETSQQNWGQLDEQFSNLEKKVHGLFDKVLLLESHENKYFNSLNEAGLSELISIKNAISKVLMDCKSLRMAGNKEGVAELVKFLSNPFSKVYPKLISYTTADLRYLEDWERRSDDLIVSCVVKLGIMSSKFDKPDQVQRERRPTIHTLDELKRVLSEHRAN